jgi:hypothetical protein
MVRGRRLAAGAIFGGGRRRASPGLPARSCASSPKSKPPPLPTAARDRVTEFKAGRIPGARFWDIDGVCDHSTDLPHMLPSEAAFGAAADALGISNNDTVVVYDGMGLFASPRAWWTWKVDLLAGGGGALFYTLCGGDPLLGFAIETDAVAYRCGVKCCPPSLLETLHP